jgi:pimeloyl-ACP methyl ester carboxylesterase
MPEAHLRGGRAVAWKRIWRVVRKVWITAGLLATAAFVIWSVIAFPASAEARQALVSTDRVHVRATDTGWVFTPVLNEPAAGLLFFPGALVDPRAYAPLLHRVAASGHPAILVRLPRRGALGGADGSEILHRGVAATLAVPAVNAWVVAGHSRGGEVAARLAREAPPLFGGLVLIGTSHPRDFSLATTRLAVTRIYGTRDTVADVDKLQQNRRNLPATITDVRIDGGNHSQFGYYGFQTGDWPATISRDEQQRMTVAAILAALRAAFISASTRPSSSRPD